MFVALLMVGCDNNSEEFEEENRLLKQQLEQVEEERKLAEEERKLARIKAEEREENILA